MGIRPHNVAFAFKQSVWLLVFFIIVGASVVVARGGTLTDFAWGMLPGIVVSAVYFGYRLWRTQVRLSTRNNPTASGDIVADGASDSCDGSSDGGGD